MEFIQKPLHQVMFSVPGSLGNHYVLEWIPKCLFFNSRPLWKPCKNHYTKWCFMFQNHRESVMFLNGVQKTFHFKSIHFSKTIQNHYTKWCFVFQKPWESMYFCAKPQNHLKPKHFLIKEITLSKNVTFSIVEIILFQKCPISMVRDHQNMLFEKLPFLQSRE